jgi:hypothetical protein
MTRGGGDRRSNFFSLSLFEVFQIVHKVKIFGKSAINSPKKTSTVLGYRGDGRKNEALRGQGYRREDTIIESRFKGEEEEGGEGRGGGGEYYG